MKHEIKINLIVETDTYDKKATYESLLNMIKDFNVTYLNIEVE